jgi:diaminopimelate decarboxylase
MANDHPQILACIRREGIGAFVNSERHLTLALEAGFRPPDIIYAASNMTRDELAARVRAGVNLVLDSLGQLETLASLRAGGLDIGVRLNVGSALDKRDVRPDPSYRFGILQQEIAAAVSLARRAGLRIVGAHSYFGTDIRDPRTLLRGLDRLAQAAAALPDLRYLDVGGGFGVPDSLNEPEFDLGAYGRGAADLLRDVEHRLRRPIDVYVEPGRYLTSDCGYFFVRVVDRKLRPDRVFVGTNASIAGFPRPLLYPDVAKHPCTIVGGEARRPHSTPVWVCGNSTYSQDFFARGIALPLPNVGETLVFQNAGAYGRSMVTRFLGKEMPQEVVLDPRTSSDSDYADSAAEALVGGG